MIDFSIVIPTYNRCNNLKKCIISIAKQNFDKSKYEIIIIDDGSDDNTKDVVKYLKKKYKINLKYIYQINGGPARARNLGIKNSKGRYILFTGDDCILDKNCLRFHNEIHNKKSKCIVLGYTYLPENSRFMRFLSKSGMQAAYFLLEGKKTFDYGFFYTTNISGPKKIFKKIKFDENFPYAAFEDIELGYRLQKLGIDMIYEPNAIVFHDHPTELKMYIKRNILAGISAAYFAKKHPEVSKRIIGTDSLSKLVIKKIMTLLFPEFMIKITYFFAKEIEKYDGYEIILEVLYKACLLYAFLLGIKNNKKALSIIDELN